MKCHEVQKVLSASFDGEARGARVERARAHLAHCAECRSFEADLKCFAAALGTLSAPEPAAGFVDRTLALISETHDQCQPRFSLLSRLRPATVVQAALALTCGAVLAILTNTDTSAQAPKQPEMTSAYYAEYFAPLPEYSVGANYLALVERGEK